MKNWRWLQGRATPITDGDYTQNGRIDQTKTSTECRRQRIFLQLGLLTHTGANCFADTPAKQSEGKNTPQKPLQRSTSKDQQQSYRGGTDEIVAPATPKAANPCDCRTALPSDCFLGSGPGTVDDCQEKFACSCSSQRLISLQWLGTAHRRVGQQSRSP